MSKPTLEREVIVNTPTPTESIELRYVVGEFATGNVGFASCIRIIRDKVSVYKEKFQSHMAPRPINILLSAPPGMGKSFIAKQIAKDVGRADVEVDEVYVASMNSVSEIDDVFRRVQSIYLDGKLPAVIFDEVDSKIGNVNVYNRFLSPMWDGRFFVAGRRHTLPPCIFFFAGSTITPKAIIDTAITQAEEKRDRTTGAIPYGEFRSRWNQLFNQYVSSESQSKPEKIEDFVSRIDDVVLIPPIDRVLSREDADLEYKRMACVLIRKHHGENMRTFHKVALDLLATTIARHGLRQAEKIIFISNPVQPHVFSFLSLPEDYRTSSGVADEDWEISSEAHVIGVSIVRD